MANIPEKKCFFCDQPLSKVKVLVVPSAKVDSGICDQCVKLCIDFLFEKRLLEIKKSIDVQNTHGEGAIDVQKQSDPSGPGQHSPDDDNGEAMPEQT